MSLHIKFGILTISDRCNEGVTDDKSGAALRQLIAQDDDEVFVHAITSDSVDGIQTIIRKWSDENCLDVIITSGGTGFTKRDVTPEAVSPLLDKNASGIVTALTVESMKMTPFAMLSRPVSGVRNSTLIVTFPGSEKACRECYSILRPVLKHCVLQLRNQTAEVRKDHGESIAPLIVQSKVANIPPAFRDRKSQYPMVCVDEAMDIIMRKTRYALKCECISIETPQKLIGRILCEDIASATPLPPFEASMKDGYAVIASDGAGTRFVNPLASTAGIDPSKLGVISGFCVRINTGAPLPKGADAVVQVEDTELVEFTEGGEEKLISLKYAPKLGQDIRAIGSDITEGEVILEKFTQLGPIEIGLIAAAGLKTVEVYKQPIVGLLSTGDEIIIAGQIYKFGNIWDSNKTTLLSLFEQQHFETRDFGIAKDDADDLLQKMSKAFDDVDILVTTGGVSMGEKDLLKRVLIEDFNATIHFGRVNLKPGKPCGFAVAIWKSSPKYVFLLPGNPVSAYVTAFLFTIPALCVTRSRGEETTTDNSTHNAVSRFHKTLRVQLELDKPMSLDERPEFARAIITFETSGMVTCKLTKGSQRSSRLQSVRQANALVIIPQKSSTQVEIRPNTYVIAILLN